MRKFSPVRLALVAALAAPSAVAVVALAGPASASGLPPTVTCTSLNSTLGGTGTTTGCTPTSAVGTPGTGHEVSTASKTSPNTSTTTWENGTTTTSVTTTPKAVTGKKDKCGKGILEYTVTATVTGGTNTVIKVGEVGADTVCVNLKAKKGATNAVTLLKGTKSTI